MILIDLPAKMDITDLCTNDGMFLLGELLACMALGGDKEATIYHLDQLLWGLEEPPAYTGKSFYAQFAELAPLMSSEQLEQLKSEILRQHIPAVDCSFEGGRSVSINVFCTA